MGNVLWDLLCVQLNHAGIQNRLKKKQVKVVANKINHESTKPIQSFTHSIRL